MNLNEKTIIVTGAGGGIGAATAVHLARLGAHVALVDISNSAKVVADDIVADGGSAALFVADVGDSEQVAEMVANVVERFGRLDGAFNNAGVEQSGVPLHELTNEQWDRAVRIDLTGVFNCVKHEVRAMLETGGGAIVNTASGLGKVAIPNASEYVAAKHGVIGLTRAAAADYGRLGIRVNAVLPGIIRTPMIERLVDDPQFSDHFDRLRERHLMNRFGEPSEIGSAVAWLLSSGAAFVTGEALAVDGGFLAN
jgi:2,5-dichloro-2,5-cyclohexadiene-1,4-diol dehydrogenase 1